MANRISQLRKSINLSQVDLAKQMGVGQSTISNWESEKTSIDSEALTKLSKLLIASAGYILGIEDGPYNGLSEKQYRSMCEEKHDKAEAEAIIREYERDESALEDESFNDYRAQCIYDAWEDAGNPGYIESFVSAFFRWQSSCSPMPFISPKANLSYGEVFLWPQGRQNRQYSGYPF